MAGCFLGRSPLINSGGESKGESDLADAVRTAVINKRAGGMGLISGRKAFQGDSFATTLYKILQDVPEPLQNIDASLPYEVVRLVEKSIAKMKDERYQDLSDLARDLTRSAGPPPLTRARHRAALAEAVERLRAARCAPLAELRGEDLRLALRSMGRITGSVGVEEILDSVFRQFCIGK